MSLHHHEGHFTAGAVVRDIVIGMSDGLTVPFALAAGLTGAISQTDLIEHLYLHEEERDPNTIEVYIARIRRKLGRDVIRTQRGLGYRLG